MGSGGPESRTAGSRAPPGSPPVWAKGDAELLHTVDVQPGATDWRGGQPADTPSYGWRQNPNIAVGTITWGPFAASADPTAATGPSLRSIRCAWSHPSDRRCHLFSLTNLYSLLGATSTSIGLGEKRRPAAIRPC